MPVDYKGGTLNGLSFLLLLLLMIVIGQIVAKLGAWEAKETGKSFNIFLGLAYVILMLRGVVWVYILNKFKLGFVSPVISLTYIIMLFVSYIYFGDIITFTRLFGCILIASGVFMVMVGENISSKTNHE